jgi:hypothetical protein
MGATTALGQGGETHSLPCWAGQLVLELVERLVAGSAQKEMDYCPPWRPWGPFYNICNQA